MVIIAELEEDFKEFLECPVCGYILGSRGRRARRLRHYANDVELVYARRYHCNKCRSNHTVLPCTVYPERHYARSIIEDILEGYVTEKDDLTLYGPSKQTIRRWLRA